MSNRGGGLGLLDILILYFVIYFLVYGIMQVVAGK